MGSCYSSETEIKRSQKESNFSINIENTNINGKKVKKEKTKKSTTSKSGLKKLELEDAKFYKENIGLSS